MKTRQPASISQTAERKHTRNDRTPNAASVFGVVGYDIPLIESAVSCDDLCQTGIALTFPVRRKYQRGLRVFFPRIQGISVFTIEVGRRPSSRKKIDLRCTESRQRQHCTLRPDILSC